MSDYEKFLAGAKKVFAKFPSAHKKVFVRKKLARNDRRAASVVANPNEVNTCIGIFIQQKLSNITQEEKKFVEGQIIIISSELTDSLDAQINLGGNHEIFIAPKTETDIVNAREYKIYKVDTDPENVARTISVVSPDYELE